MAGIFSKLGSAALSAAEGFISSGIEYNAQIEKYTTGFTNMLGSAEAAQQVMSQIQEDAAKTPFDAGEPDTGQPVPDLCGRERFLCPQYHHGAGRRGLCDRRRQRRAEPDVPEPAADRQHRQGYSSRYQAVCLCRHRRVRHFGRLHRQVHHRSAENDNQL